MTHRSRPDTRLQALFLSTFLASASLIAACGGGDGGSPAPAPAPGPAPAPSPAWPTAFTDLPAATDGIAIAPVSAGWQGTGFPIASHAAPVKYRPVLRAAGTGQALAVWLEDEASLPDVTSGTTVQWRQLHPTRGWGGKVSVPRSVSAAWAAGRISDLDAALRADGTAAVVWRDQAACRLRVAVNRPAGAETDAWQVGDLTPVDCDRPARLPSLQITSSGHVVAAWVQPVTGGEQVWRRVLRGSAWDAPQALAADVLPAGGIEQLRTATGSFDRWAAVRLERLSASEHRLRATVDDGRSSPLAQTDWTTDASLPPQSLQVAMTVEDDLGLSWLDTHVTRTDTTATFRPIAQASILRHNGMVVAPTPLGLLSESVSGAAGADVVLVSAARDRLVFAWNDRQGSILESFSRTWTAAGGFGATANSDTIDASMQQVGVAGTGAAGSSGDFVLMQSGARGRLAVIQPALERRDEVSTASALYPALAADAQARPFAAWVDSESTGFPRLMINTWVTPAVARKP